TTSAPWLVPVSAGSLAADQQATGQAARQAPQDIGTHLISAALLHGAGAADQDAALVQSIRVTPAPQLSRAVAGIESSAWRGSAAGQRQARAMLRRVMSYLAAQERGISIVEPGRDTLGGQTGPIPISIDNRLPYPVRVRVVLRSSQGVGGGFAVLSNPGVIKIPANNILTKQVRVRASAIGSTTVSLRLVAPDGQPLLGAPVNMTVQATHFGTLELIALAAALAMFVIVSAGRAIRRGQGSSEAGPPGEPGQPGEAASLGDATVSRHDDAIPVAGPGEENATGQGGHEKAEGTDNVGHDRAAPGPVGTDLAATEDADDYARVPGWADRS
ncbi:MAG: DUF6049 family protein, partial [Streptosporangiaceae bacterium]